MKDDRDDDGRVGARLIELPSPFPLQPGTLRFIESSQGSSADKLDLLREGTLGVPFVIDNGTVRNLFFNNIASIQSSMLLDEPDALLTAYTRKMMSFLLFVPAPCHVLMIGLGGGSLAKFCYRRLPQTRISVIEISADVIALREHFAIPPDDERFEIIHDDGAPYLARAPVRPDVILIDAFDEFGVAPSLASSDFYLCASESLAPDGALVMNLSGERSRYPVHIQSIREAFAGAVLLVPVEGHDNVLLFAFKLPQLIALPDTLHGRAAELEKELGLEFLRFLERLRGGLTVNTATITPLEADRECKEAPPNA